MDQSKLVLIVDDNEDAAQSLALLLQTRGFKTEVVNDGAAALRRVHDHGFDVVILDVELPEMDGIAVARQIHAAPLVSKPRLIALTGLGLSPSEKKAFHSYLVKPVDPEDLLKVIHDEGSL